MKVKLVKHYSPLEGNYVGLYVNGKPVQYVYGSLSDKITEVTLEEGTDEWEKVDQDSSSARRPPPPG